MWALCVGPEIRRRARVAGCRQGRWEVVVEEGDWWEALRHLESEILDRLNRAGGGYRSVRFRRE